MALLDTNRQVDISATEPNQLVFDVKIKMYAPVLRRDPALLPGRNRPPRGLPILQTSIAAPAHNLITLEAMSMTSPDDGIKKIDGGGLFGYLGKADVLRSRQ
jgi:hypothetical protein